MQPDAILHDRYRVIYAVDERPNGQVYRARDTQSDQLVLIGALPQADAEALRDSQLLVRQVATVHHGVLLPVQDHFSDNLTYYIVCADPGGQDVDRALRARGGPLPEQDVLAQARRLLELLEHLHQQKPRLCLGDLWPSDIMVTEGEWRLTPFALARLIVQSPSPYRAPELANVATEPTQPSDTYAVSALLYHMLTGWAPPTAEQQAAGMPLNGPRSLNPQLSTLAEQALLRGLQQRAANRYQNAREMRLALETVQLMAGRSLGLGPDVLTAQPGSVVAPEAPAAPPPGATMISQPLGAPPPAAAAGGDVLQAVPAAPAPAPEQARRGGGIRTGCLIAIALGLLVLVLGIAGAIAVLLGGGGPLNDWLFGARAPGASVASGQAAPVAPGPNAITLANAKEITQTATIVGEVFGPIAMAPDGNRLVVGINNTLSIRSVPGLEEQRRVDGLDGDVTALAWSADGALLASGVHGDPTIVIWNAETGEQIRAIEGHDDWIRTLAFSPDGAALASGSVDRTIRVWDVGSGEQLRSMSGHSEWVSNIVFSPDGQRLFSSSRDGTVRAWTVATGREQRGFTFALGDNPSTDAPYLATGLAVSPDGTQVAVGGTDGLVHLLDATTGEEQHQLRGHNGWVVLRGVVFAPDGKSVISAGLDGTIRVWNADTGVASGTLDGHRLHVLGITISGDGQLLASISNEEARVVLWDMSDRKEVTSFSAGQGLITGLTYAPDGSALGTTGYSGALKIHPLGGGDNRTLLGSSRQTQSLALLRNNNIATVSDQGSVMLIGAGEAQGRQLEGLDGEPASIAATRDGSTVAVGSRTGAIALWDGASGQARQRLRGDLSGVAAVAVSDDGTLLAASGPAPQSQIEVWDVASGKRLHTLVGAREGVIALSFQPGSALLAAIDGGGEMLAWDARSAKLIHIVSAPDQASQYTALTFSADGAMIVAGTVGGQVVFWDAATGAEGLKIQMADDVILALAFSPNGEQLAVSARSEDGAVYLFELPERQG